MFFIAQALPTYKTSSSGLLNELVTMMSCSWKRLCSTKKLNLYGSVCKITIIFQQESWLCISEALFPCRQYLLATFSFTWKWALQQLGWQHFFLFWKNHPAPYPSTLGTSGVLFTLPLWLISLNLKIKKYPLARNAVVLLKFKNIIQYNLNAITSTNLNNNKIVFIE